MDATEKLIVELIDDHQKEIINFATDIWNHAELGFKEERTAKKFSEALQKQGLKTQEHLALTGVKGILSTGRSGPTICLMGELDALPIPNHKNTNPETGAAHCCGHNAQLAGVMGAAIALSDSNILKELCGNIVFSAFLPKNMLKSKQETKCENKV